MIKIIVADDHVVMRAGIAALLQKVEDFEIIGEAANGREVLRMLEQDIIPDVILSDLNMPAMGGLEMGELINKMNIPVKVILLTMLDHEKFVVKAFKAGINGYLLKSVTAEEMIFGIRHVYEDTRYLCVELALRFLDRLLKTPIYQENSMQVSELEFSERDIRIMELLSEGFTNQEIADKLFTGKRTVEGLRQSILDRTGIRNSAELVKFALLNGIIK
jgi:DNA-binding NarL/FixJ family response regulator